MIAVVVLRLGGPLWVAGARRRCSPPLYVPGIVGDGSFLQQPLIRFGLTATVCFYACALTTVRYRQAFVLAGTAALVLVAFSSQTTRPLLWIVAAAVIGIAARRGSTREIAWMQLRAIAVVAAAMYAGALLIATVWPKHSFLAAFTNVGLGLSTSGTAAGQVTVLSFPHFWPTDAWPFFADANATKSLFGDVRSSPLDFAAWTAYGTYANWRFPDLLYFQEFGLGTTGQVVQHVALVATGFAGLAWLIGQAGARRLIGAVVLVTVALISVLAGLVSVEPRRVGALVPLLALGAACFAWSLARRRAWGRFDLAGAVALTVCAAAWLAPVPTGLVSPEAGFAVLLLVRTAATAAVGAWLLADWRRRWDGFSIAAPAALGALLLLIVVGAQLRGGDWRAFDATFHAPIRQEVDALRLDAGKQPWLVADFGTPQEAQASAISVNGQVVKPAGAPMRRWQVDGALLGWVPYAELERMGVEEEPRTWMAVPVDPQALAGARAVDRGAPAGWRRDDRRRPRGRRCEHVRRPGAGPVLHRVLAVALDLERTRSAHPVRAGPRRALHELALRRRPLPDLRQPAAVRGTHQHAPGHDAAGRRRGDGGLQGRRALRHDRRRDRRQPVAVPGKRGRDRLLRRRRPPSGRLRAGRPGPAGAARHGDR